MSSPASSVISNEESQTFEALQGTLIETAVQLFLYDDLRHLRILLHLCYPQPLPAQDGREKTVANSHLVDAASWNDPNRPPARPRGAVFESLGHADWWGTKADAAKLASLTRSSGIIQSAQEILFTGNNFFTDIVLVYRCYAIWGFQRKIVILPSGLMIVTLVLATAADWGKLDPRYTFVAGVLTNLVLTVLTAGRLCWIQRTSSSAAPIIQQRCAKAFEIIVESGAIYCLCAAVLAITRPRDSNDSDMPVLFVITVGISYQGVNLIPTLALVRETRKALEEKDVEVGQKT